MDDGAPPSPQKPVPRPAWLPDGFSFFRGWLFLRNPKVLSNRSVPWQNHHELYAAHRRADGIVAADPARPASLSKGVGAQEQTQLTACAEAVHPVLYGIGDQLGSGMVNHELQRTGNPVLSDRSRLTGQGIQRAPADQDGNARPGRADRPKGTPAQGCRPR